VRPLLPESLTQLQKRVTSFTHFQICCVFYFSSADRFLKCVNHVNFINNSVMLFSESQLNFSKILFMKNAGIMKKKPHHLNWSPLIGIAVTGIGGVIL
jgi:hypothetical protein